MKELKSYKPLFTGVLVTSNEVEQTVSGLILTTNKGIDEIQEVVEVGTAVRDVKKGDKVLLDFGRYAIKRHSEGSVKDGIVCDNPIISYDLPYVDVNGARYLRLDIHDVVAIVETKE